MKNVKAKLVLQVGKSLGAEIGWKRSVDQQRARTKEGRLLFETAKSTSVRRRSSTGSGCGFLMRCT